MIFELKPGDAVRFTNFLGEGTVLRVQGEMVWVRDDLGIELQLTWKDVVPVFKPEKDLPDFRPASKSVQTEDDSAKPKPSGSEPFDWSVDAKPKVPKVKSKEKPVPLKDASARSSDLPTSDEKEGVSVPEIDIHLHEILENDFGMDDYDKLQYQLNYLKKEIARLRGLHHREMIIVHGVGKGRLRDEVRALMAAYPDLAEMFDASFKKYGAGATQVIFKQSKSGKF